MTHPFDQVSLTLNKVCLRKDASIMFLTWFLAIQASNRVLSTDHFARKQAVATVGVWLRYQYGAETKRVSHIDKKTTDVSYESIPWATGD